MKTLVSAAVYGLVPVPPMLDTRGCSDSDNRAVAAEDMKSSQPKCFEHRVVTERMATKDELARIRRELEELSGDWGIA